MASANWLFSSPSNSFLISSTVVMVIEEEALEVVRDAQEKAHKLVADSEQETWESMMKNEQEKLELAMTMGSPGDVS